MLFQVDAHLHLHLHLRAHHQCRCLAAGGNVAKGGAEGEHADSVSADISATDSGNDDDDGDGSRELLRRWPLYSLATPQTCVLEAGDLLFVPAGCPHAVENLSDTLAVSCNYVDATNLARSRRAIATEAGLRLKHRQGRPF